MKRNVFILYTNNSYHMEKLYKGTRRETAREIQKLTDTSLAICEIVKWNTRF